MNLTIMDQGISSMVSQVGVKQNAPAQSQSQDRDSFDNMVRQKQKEVKSAKNQEKPRQKDEKAPDGAQQPGQEPQEVPDEQYAVAVAPMMFQALPDSSYVDLDTGMAVNPMNGPMAQLIEQPQMRQMAPDFGPMEQGPQRMPEQEAPELELRPEMGAEQAAPERMDLRQRQDLGVQAEETAQVQGAQDEDEEIQAEDVRYQAPLFGYMDARPVRVAAPDSDAIPLERSDGMEQLASRLGEMLEENPELERVELNLDPPNLGKITVELTHAEDGSLHILLTATTARAAEALTRNSDSLQQMLAANNRPSVEVEVRSSQEVPQQQLLNPDANGQQQQQQQQQQQNRRQHPAQAQDFVQQLRLGLVDAEESE